MSAPHSAQPASPLELLLPATSQSMTQRARAVGGCFALLLELATETKNSVAVTFAGTPATEPSQGDTPKRATHERV